ncbi:hypothetical protein MBANPS3_012231 [Mucor bainieri]
MWIYKNPQGLLILEDELNERRKRRSARHRSSPPLPSKQAETNSKQSPPSPPQQCQHQQEYREKVVLTPPAMQLSSPSDVLIPVAKKAVIDVKPINNIFIEKPLKQSTLTENSTIEKSRQPLKPTGRTNLIEERSKLFKSSNSSNTPKEMPKLMSTTSHSKQKIPQIKPRSIPPNQENQLLSSVKHRLSPVKPKVDTISNKIAESDGPVAPPRRKGLVSSFVSAFESPSPDASSPGRDSPTRSHHINKPRALMDVKPTASQSCNLVSSSRLLSHHDPLPPIKPRRQAVMPSPSTTVSSPALSTPSPFNAAIAIATAPTDSYFPIVATASSPEQKQATLNEPQIKISPSLSSPIESVPCSNEINVYLPQLSPEISFHEDLLEDVSAGEQDEEEDSDDDEPLDKEVASILVRPEIKKRVSFSDQLLTYIPEQQQQQASDDDTASIKSSEAPSPKNPMLDFSRALSFELSDVKTKLIAERRVNTTPSRDKYVPAAVTRKLFEPEVAPKRPSVANVHAPQKLSNKLLDMFQQKLSAKPSPVEQQQQQLPKSQQPESRGLVHLTKSRPRKPPSLKKPTYPAATAQPNWRERATNRKYEFIA